MANLEDRTFGPEDPPECKSPVIPPPPPACFTERIANHMFPFVVTAIMIVAIVWSINKSIEYSELFQGNKRYRWTMLVSNAMVVLIGISLLLYNTHHA